MTKNIATGRMIGRGAAALALALLLAAPTQSLAQPAPAPAPAAPEAAPPPPSAAAPKPVTHHHRTARKHMSRVDAQIARLQAELKITPAQTPEWDAVADIMRAQAREMEKLARDRAAARASMTAVDDLKSYQAIAVAHAEEMGKLVPAFQALYAKMSPAQQKNADAVFAHHRRARTSHKKSSAK
jgi:periplasmic protein CpxP/Spy